jgi:hypothetical protein
MGFSEISQFRNLLLLLFTKTRKNPRKKNSKCAREARVKNTVFFGTLDHRDLYGSERYQNGNPESVKGTK